MLRPTPRRFTPPSPFFSGIQVYADEQDFSRQEQDPVPSS
ncbi:hypothetical protein AWT69_000294 [Pseudomonas putida]|nr:hypothetical protein AWT69_000294 [Pseudomonas putida]